MCGNGGSAAIANHLVCDYIKLMRKNTNLTPKVISLSTSIELITAISNDFSYDRIFSDQLEYLARKNDLLVLISSSGNSKNIVNAIKFCKKNNIRTVGLSGFNGGYLARNSEISLNLNCENYGISEDSHHILMHVVIQFLRQKYLKSNIKKLSFKFINSFLNNEKNLTIRHTGLVVKDFNKSKFFGRNILDLRLTKKLRKKVKF